MDTKLQEIKLPKDETPWENYIDENGEVRYVIATKNAKIRDTYFLFCKEGEGWKKLRSSSTPEALQKLIILKENENER